MPYKLLYGTNGDDKHNHKTESYRMAVAIAAYIISLARSVSRLTKFLKNSCNTQGSLLLVTEVMEDSTINPFVRSSILKRSLTEKVENHIVLVEKEASSERGRSIVDGNSFGGAKGKAPLSLSSEIKPQENLELRDTRLTGKKIDKLANRVETNVILLERMDLIRSHEKSKLVPSVSKTSLWMSKSV